MHVHSQIGYVDLFTIHRVVSAAHHSSVKLPLTLNHDGSVEYAVSSTTESSADVAVIHGTSTSMNRYLLV